jgi:hypothetical protein
VLLDSTDYVNDPVTTSAGSFQYGCSLGDVPWSGSDVTFRHFLLPGIMRNSPGGRSGPFSCRRPSSNVDELSNGCHVADLRGPPRRSQTARCRREPRNNRSQGRRSSPQHHAGGAPLVSWVDALLANRKMGSRSSQFLWCAETTFLRRSSTVSTYRPTILSDCGCGGVVHVLLTPRCSNISCISRDLVFWPWSICSSFGTPKRQKKLVTRTSAIVDASWYTLAYPLATR